MCSISGMILYNHETKGNNFFKLAFDNMRHRGPDFEKTIKIGNVALAHQRLSIIDVSDNGNQPFTYKHLTIVFNGEIYNYKEIKEKYFSDVKFKSDSDTEVLLHFYLKKGLSCLNELNGMFAFAIYDNKTKETILCRDRFGIKPLYYMHEDENFYFSSEMKPLIEFKKDIKRNNVVYNNFFKDTASDYDENTFVNDIYQLKPGHYKIMDKSQNSQVKWYTFSDFSFDKKIFSNKKKTQDFFENLLTESIDLRLRSDVPLCITLSGGLDSSLIYVLIKERLKKIIQPFTYSHPGSPTCELGVVKKLVSSYDDSVIEIKSKSYVSKEEIIAVRQQLDFTSWGVSVLAYNNTYKEIRKRGFVVVLEGHGADEQLGGYPYMVLCAFKEAIKKRQLLYAVKLGYVLFKTFNPNLNQTNYFYYTKKFLSSLTKQKSSEKKSVSQKNKMNFQETLEDSFDYKILPIVLRTFDRLSMSNSLESRCPFMDYRVVEFLRALPMEHKVNSIGSKAILRGILKKYDKDYIYKNKVKMGFALDEPKFYNQKDNKKFVVDLIQKLDLPAHNKSKSKILEILKTRKITWSDTNDLWKLFSISLVEKDVFKNDKK